MRGAIRKATQGRFLEWQGVCGSRASVCRYIWVTVPSLVWDEKCITIINPNTAVMKCNSRNSAVLHDRKPVTAGNQIWDSYFENGITAAKSNSFCHSSQCRKRFLTHASSFLLWFLNSYKAGNKDPQHYIQIPGCTYKGATGKKMFSVNLQVEHVWWRRPARSV